MSDPKKELHLAIEQVALRVMSLGAEARAEGFSLEKSTQDKFKWLLDSVTRTERELTNPDIQADSFR